MMFGQGPVLPDRLNPWPKTRVVCWLLDTGPRVTVPEHVALIQDIDATVTGIAASAIAMTIMSMLSLVQAAGWYFGVVAGASAVVNLFRTALVTGLARGRLKHAPAVTDVHVISTLVWAGILGAMVGGMEASDVRVLQVIGGMTSLGFQGLLCARNYPAPRFAMTLLMLIDLPCMAGCVLAADHWMIAALALTPPWIVSSAATVKRFQLISLQSYAARLDSWDQARRDPLTHALNRLGLNQVCEDTNLPEKLTLFCLDLDGFKQVNDTLGHSAGDTLLRLVTERLRHCIHKDDALARCGGDEFVIVALLMGVVDAEAFAARLIESVTAAPYSLHGGTQARIGLSVGFACRPLDDPSMERLSALADQALYQAKRAGKGKWRWAGRSNGTDTKNDALSTTL